MIGRLGRSGPDYSILGAFVRGSLSFSEEGGG